jgi:deoxyribose-phosphate aldolase
VKNSSGWGKGGTPATVEDVLILTANVVGSCRVKVSGKVNTLEKMMALFQAGYYGGDRRSRRILNPAARSTVDSGRREEAAGLFSMDISMRFPLTTLASWSSLAL